MQNSGKCNPFFVNGKQKFNFLIWLRIEEDLINRYYLYISISESKIDKYLSVTK